jgi:large subunit ribosomal protein L25
MTEKVRVKVGVELIGVAVGVKTEGGLLDFIHRDVEIECLPGDIPAHLTLDVAEVHVGQNREASSLSLPPGVTLVDPHRVLVSVKFARVAEPTTEEAAAAGESAEPELIGKGKTPTAEEPGA